MDSYRLALLLGATSPSAPLFRSHALAAPARIEISELALRNSSLWHLLRPHADAARNGHSPAPLVIAAATVRALAAAIAGEPTLPYPTGEMSEPMPFWHLGRKFWRVSELSVGPNLPIPPGCRGQQAMACSRVLDVRGSKHIGYWYARV